MDDTSCRTKRLSLALGAILSLVLSASCTYAQGDPRPPAPETEAAKPAGEPAAYAAPLPRGRTLILTDGSFQIVREYERQGDRVRYYSVERSSWEEIPTEMVDWPATEKAGAETAASQQETLDRLRVGAASDVAVTIDTGSSLLVGSGVFLPDSAGFYVLDGQTVLGLVQVEAQSRIDKGRAILKGISGVPFISTKRIIEVPGKRAKVRIQNAEPEFFIRTADGRSPKLALVRADINAVSSGGEACSALPSCWVAWTVAAEASSAAQGVGSLKTVSVTACVDRNGNSACETSEQPVQYDAKVTSRPNRSTRRNCSWTSALNCLPG